MNTIATFRKCILSDEELIEKVDQLTDEMFTTQKVPTRNIPARPNDDYDLLVGELILRFRSTGIKDRNGNEIFFGQTLRFADKWEWYRGQYGPKLMFARDGQEKKKIMAEFEKEPYEERIVEGIQDYEWLLSSEVQRYWEIVEAKPSEG